MGTDARENATNEYSPHYPHEPAIPPTLDDEGRCLICHIEVDRDRAVAALRALDALNPADFKTDREPNFRDAFRDVCRIVNRVLHGRPTRTVARSKDSAPND